MFWILESAYLRATRLRLCFSSELARGVHARAVRETACTLTSHLSYWLIFALFSPCVAWPGVTTLAVISLDAHFTVLGSPRQQRSTRETQGHSCVNRAETIIRYHSGHVFLASSFHEIQQVQLMHSSCWRSLSCLHFTPSG